MIHAGTGRDSGVVFEDMALRYKKRYVKNVKSVTSSVQYVGEYVRPLATHRKFLRHIILGRVLTMNLMRWILYLLPYCPIP